jgi:AAA15 family ATPase/GTPase
MDEPFLQQERYNIVELSISNFKAFATEVNLNLRPITLIFGANSSGKSSIIHALLLLHQLSSSSDYNHAARSSRYIKRDNPIDISITELGEGLIDLGGYPYYVHRHDPHNTVCFKVKTKSTQHGRIEKTSSESYSTNQISFFSEDTKTGEDRVIFQSRFLVDQSTLLTSKTTFTRRNEEITKYTDVELSDHPFIKLSIQDIYEKSLKALEAIIKYELQDKNKMEAIAQAFKEIRNNIDLFGLFENNYTIGMLRIIKDKSASVYAFDASSFLLRFFRPAEDLVIDCHLQILGHHQSLVEFQNRDYLQSLIQKNQRIWFSRFMHLHHDWYSRSQGILYLRKRGSLIIPIASTTRALQNLVYVGPLRSLPARDYNLESASEQKRSDGTQLWINLPNTPHLIEKINAVIAEFSISYKLVVSDPTNTITVERMKFNKLLESVITGNHNSDQKQLAHDLSATIRSPSGRKSLKLLDLNTQTVVSHRDVGVGISQVLPIFVNCYGERNATICIEQPELHLHPRFQGDLADVFIETTIGSEQNNSYIIETHSEAIIRRLMRRVREGKIRKEDISIVYVEPGQNGSTVTQIHLDDDGDLIDEWPNGFFEEGFRDSMAGRK